MKIYLAFYIQLNRYKFTKIVLQHKQIGTFYVQMFISLIYFMYLFKVRGRRTLQRILGVSNLFKALVQITRNIKWLFFLIQAYRKKGNSTKIFPIVLLTAWFVLLSPFQLILSLELSILLLHFFPCKHKCNIISVVLFFNSIHHHRAYQILI